MQTEPSVLPFDQFEKILSAGIIKNTYTKHLVRGVYAKFYEGTIHCVAIQRTILQFSFYNAASNFYNATHCPPAGIPYEFNMDISKFEMPVDLQYHQKPYEAFVRRGLSSSYLKIISESILKDGRVSVMYADVSYHNGQEPDCYFLVIGTMVFKDGRIERLIKLESAINNGTATYWRPELAGTMDHIPEYSISEYTKHHERYISKATIIKICDLPGGEKANIYELKLKNTRYYMRAGSKIYMFSSLLDCDLILSKIMATTLPPAPVGEDERLIKYAQLISLRICRYMSADIGYSPSKAAAKVSQTGSFIYLNSGLL